MVRARRTIVFLLGLFMVVPLIACGSKAPALGSGSLLQNVVIFKKDPGEVWRNLTRAVRVDFLIPMEVIDERKGYFSSRLMRELKPNRKTQYRLSGALDRTDNGIAVTLYKHEQVFSNGKWRTTKSDGKLEMEILRRLKELLEEKD